MESLRRTTVSGRSALVAYLTDDLKPADPKTATLVKATFDDGKQPSSMFLIPERPQLLKYSAEQARDDHGRWSAMAAMYEAKAEHYKALGAQHAAAGESQKAKDSKRVENAHRAAAEKIRGLMKDHGGVLVKADGLLIKYNQNHTPAGSSDGGQFTTDSGGGGGEKMIHTQYGDRPYKDSEKAHQEAEAEAAKGKTVMTWKHTRTGKPMQKTYDTHGQALAHAAMIHHNFPNHPITISSKGTDGRVIHTQYGDRSYANSEMAQQAQKGELLKFNHNHGERGRFTATSIDRGDGEYILPEDHARYFNMGNANAVVPMRQLVTDETDPAKLAHRNAGRFMRPAFEGKGPKRDPISVSKQSDGKYKIEDGVGTWVAAYQAGWKEMPVHFVDAGYRDVHGSSASYGKAELLKFNQNHAPAGGPTGGQFTSAGGGAGGGTTEEVRKITFKPEALKGVTKDGRQPWNTKEELYQHAPQAKDQYEEWLDKGHGIVSQMGGERVNQSPESLTPKDWEKPGALFFMAGLKKEASATEKTYGENGGRWDQLLDVVRGTVAVDKVSDVQRVVDAMTASGMQLGRLPKDRLSEATHGGWRGDLLLNYKMPNGMLAEVQIGLKSMYEAKFVGGGHKIYEDIRSISRSYPDKSPSEYSPADQARYAALDRKSRDFYNSYWQKTAAQGLLKMAGHVTYVETEDAYFKLIDGLPDAVLIDGEWEKPAGVNWAKASIYGLEISQNEIDRAIVAAKEAKAILAKGNPK